MLYPLLATLAWLLLIAGWTARRRRRAHVPLVLAGIGVDLAIVLLLEFQRSVVAGALEAEWTAFQITHIVASALAVVLYLPTLFLGFRLLRGKPGPKTRRRHRNVAVAALALRTVGFVCMWSI